MPSSYTRKELEIPADLWNVLDQIAEKVDMPTSALAAHWLWEMLQIKSREPGNPAEGFSTYRPYRFGPPMYPRRKKSRREESKPTTES